jgi:hypothetical protein
MNKYEALLKDALPDGWSYGYIGNVYSDGTDDRHWKIFTPAITRCGYGTGVGGWESATTPNVYEKLWEYWDNGSALKLYERQLESGEWRLK